MSMQPSGDTIVLPPGYSIVGNRETSQSNAMGQIVQGINFSLGAPNGSTFSVFVPYQVLNNVQQTQALFNQRIAALNTVLNATTS